jgi:CubicO group peptidase (beta-lactamase class C family)
MRKSLLGALIGQEVAAGRLGLQRTLAELAIDDDPPLTAQERQATVDDLLHSRSGVYHSALYEVGMWKRMKPERGSQPPGAFWYYNNWDFNTLGTLFERSSGSTVGEAFRDRIAEPTGMQDFRAEDVVYLTRSSLSEKMQHNASDHPAYVFMISARDLARFGLLYLAQGRWRETQVVPREWVEATWQGVSIGAFEERLGEGVTYGKLWWVYPAEWMGGRPGTKAYIARGNRGHWLVVLPDLELVLVHRVATGGVGLASQLKRRFLGSSSVDDGALLRLLRRVIAAHPAMAAG